LNYYVYYKIALQDAGAVRSRVQRLFDIVEKQIGVRGRWMRRRDDPSTYMEVYEGVGDEVSFEALIASEGAKVGPNRRVERFVSA
jgi:hypothetical protein